MFSRISRYYRLPDIVTTDAKGRTLVSKALRLSPPVQGSFRHTLEEVDRLDHLAYKYYQQPRKWWRISDANPDFMSPAALLGKGPVVTERFSLTFPSPQPPWATLIQDLTGRVGVEEVKVEEEVHLVPEQQTLNGQTLTVHVEQFERAVVVTYNQLNLSSADIGEAMQALGFGVEPPERIGRVGKQISIPPDTLG